MRPLLGYQPQQAPPLTQAPPPRESRSTLSHRNFYWKQTSCSKVTLSARCPMGKVGGTSGQMTPGTTCWVSGPLGWSVEAQA